jgi:hypothetical protein
MLIKDYLKDDDSKISELKDLLRESFYRAGNKVEFYDYEITLVESFGGEGMGDSSWNVYEFSKKDGTNKHNMKVDLYYSSYEGEDWSCWYSNFYKVQPKEVLVTKWFKE